MATSLKFDELNRLDYRKYFGEMFITPEQMRERIALAEEIEDIIVFLLAYYAIYEDAELEIDSVQARLDAKERMTSVVEKHMRLDPYIENHIDKAVDEIADVTEEHIKKHKEEELKAQEEEDEDSDLDEFEKMLDEEKAAEKEKQRQKQSSEDEQERINRDWNKGFYWTSYTRAMYITANEVNAIKNYDEYREAKEAGKKRKRWLTELDDKVRFTHTLAEGQTVDIDGLFLVGGSLMRFPKDYMYDPAPEEVINCRCAVQYI